MFRQRSDGHGRMYGRGEDFGMGGRGHRRGGDGRSPHGRGGGGRRGKRIFDYGELRLLILAMLEKNSSHGYEIIKAIEDRFGGNYAPSPGVVYPTLSWLEDMRYAKVEPEDGGRKQYRISDEGLTFLAANRPAAEELLTRKADTAPSAPPANIARALENVKLALKLRLNAGALDSNVSEEIAEALDAIARKIEQN